MKKVLLTFTIFSSFIAANAQNGSVGIGTETPHASAILDLTSTNKGFLAPRVALTSTTVASPVSSPATGLMVFNTATTGDVTPGHYVWDGVKWAKIGSGAAGTKEKKIIYYEPYDAFCNYIPLSDPDADIIYVGSTVGSGSPFVRGLDTVGVKNGRVITIVNGFDSASIRNLLILHKHTASTCFPPTPLIPQRSFDLVDNKSVMLAPGETITFVYNNGWRELTKDNSKWVDVVTLTAASDISTGRLVTKEIYGSGVENLLIDGGMEGMAYYGFDVRITPGSNESNVLLNMNNTGVSLGKTGIGTATPDQKLTVFNGTTTGRYTTSGWTHTSDAREKNNIQELNYGIADINKIKAYSYRYNKDTSNAQYIGFLAQELEKVIPEVVVTDSKSGEKSIAYGMLEPILVQAIKEQQAMILELKAEIEKLKNNK